MQQKPIDLKALIPQLPGRALNSVLFNFANAYNEAGQIVHAAMLTKRNADYVAPMILCKSFSIELLLKYFIIVTDHPLVATSSELKMSGVNLRGHLYSELYDKIGARFKKQISESFSLLAKRKTDEIGFREILVQLGDDPFVFWRYVYEYPEAVSFDLELMNLALDALGSVAATERVRIKGVSVAGK